MENNLKQNIAQISQSKNLTYRKLEEKAGLHKNFISNLLAADSNPRIDSIIKLADAFEISIDELIGRKSNFATNQTVDTSCEFDLELFTQIVGFITNSPIIKNNSSKFRIKKVLQIIEEIYSYCYLKNNKKFDSGFTDWYLDKMKNTF